MTTSNFKELLKALNRLCWASDVLEVQEFRVIVSVAHSMAVGWKAVGSSGYIEKRELGRLTDNPKTYVWLKIPFSEKFY